MALTGGSRQPLPRRLRGGDDRAMFGAGCCGACLVLSFFFVASLGPNQYGVLRNWVTGDVSAHAYRGGIHVIGPTRAFITFPASQMTLLFSGESGADRGVVETRTGADHGQHYDDDTDANSGGQPINISCAIQYEFVSDRLKHVYLDFGSYEASKQRAILLASNMISNTAQEFTPQNFWTMRREIAERMLSRIQYVLLRDAHVNATRFEVLKIDFAARFEDSITAVQVAEQQTVVNEYDQQVQAVAQSIEVLRAMNQAHITRIGAQAEGLARQQVANATRDGFNMKQGMKATKYAQLKRALGFGEVHMGQYFKIKSVQGQEGQGGEVVVGIPRVGGPMAVPPRTEL